jgi:hypothetical protein
MSGVEDNKVIEASKEKNIEKEPEASDLKKYEKDPEASKE